MTEMFPILLDLAGGTGAWSAPYREAGCDVRVVTLPQDLRLYAPPRGVRGILAAPPCTEFSFAKHYHGKGKYKHDFLSGLSVVDACIRIAWLCRDTLLFWALENPKGYLERFLGKPQFSFDPWQFGDGYQKRTCLWGKFNPPEATVKSKPADLLKFSLLRSENIHAEYGHLTRQERRAITPAGFARAFFEANPLTEPLK